MKSLMILALFAWIPGLLSAAPFQRFIPKAAKSQISCANFKGLWRGECYEESDDGSSRTYPSRFKVNQDGCESIEFRDLIGNEDRAYSIGRTQANISNDFNPFISISTYAQWQEGGKAMNIDEFISAEIQFDSSKKIAASNLKVRIFYTSDDMITLSQVFSGSVSSENGSGQNKINLRCQYKITK